jgi:anti-sigma factor RsiW
MTDSETSQPPPENEPVSLAADSERLVSYLDGEADDAASKEIEKAMVRNPAVRGEINSLQRAWDLLDYLDRPTANKEFASRTLELATRSMPETPSARPVTAPWPGKWTWRAGAVAFALAGAAAVWYRPAMDRRMERNLPILEKLDVYRATRDVEFLKQIEKENLLDQMDHLLEPES